MGMNLPNIWSQVSYILVALEINKYILVKCVYTKNLYTTGPYIRWWYGNAQ